MIGADAEPELLRLRIWLDGYAQHAESSIDASGGGAAPGSTAQGEIDSVEAARLSPAFEVNAITNAFGLALMRAVSAAAHLRGLSRLLNDLPTQFAPYTLSRAVMDLSARAFWLLDPALGPGGRLARHVSADLLYSVWESQRAGIPLSDGADPDERITLFLDWGEHHGFQPLRGSKYRPPALVEPRPSVTRLVSEMLPEGAKAYHVYAARSHGTAAGFADALVPDTHPVTEEKIARARITRADVIEITSVTIFSFSAMFDRAVDVFGWDRDLWTSWHAHVTPRLHRLWVAANAARDDHPG